MNKTDLVNAVAAAGFALGRILRKKKNAQIAAEKDTNISPKCADFQTRI